MSERISKYGLYGFLKKTGSGETVKKMLAQEL